MQYHATDIYIAAKCCSAAIDAAVNDLSLVPCPPSCVSQAITMLTIANDYAGSIVSLSGDTLGSSTTPVTTSL